METTLLLFKPCSSSSACLLLRSPNRHHIHLRSPHGALRRRCRKLGFRRGPPRCAHGDPSLSDSLLLATAAALSVIGVAFVSSTRKPRRDPAAKFSDTDISGNTFGNEYGGLGHHLDDQEFNSINILENEMPHLAVSSHENMDSKKRQPFSKRDEVLDFERAPELIPKLHVSHSHLVGFTESSRHMEMEENREVISGCVPEMLIETRNVELDIMKELLLANQYEGKGVFIFTDLRNQYSQSAIVSQAKNTLVQMIGDKEAAGESHVATSIGLLKHPTKESAGLDVAAQINHQPMSDTQNQSQVVRELSLQDNTGFNSSTPSFSRRPQMPKGGSVFAADKSEEPMPPSSSKEASSGGGKGVANLRSLPRRMNRRLISHRKSTEAKNKSLPQNRITMEAVTDVSLGLSLYNRLLREGRLSECVDLLENMEMKGFLDMDKIYHARFLKTCKECKAVAEAFRFTKLIKNTTLSTYNMLLSVCASSQNYEGASQVLLLVKDAGLRPDCQLYTTLISTCGKSGKVDVMFEVFHEMVNVGVEPNLHTYGALIDGCARAGQVAKAFGAYGIMRSKNVKPDRVIFNALITACGQSGAVDRAFDVLAEMTAEPQPLDPDHVTVGALIRTCTQTGQADRVHKVYQMLQQFKIKGTAEVYTIAVNSCSLTGDLDFALSIYEDMTKNGIVPDEMFLSTIIDVAGHAGKVDTAFEILEDAKLRGLQPGIVSYSSLMGACSKTKSWQKALELYGEIKSLKLQVTASTMNALVTCLCDGDQLLKAVEILGEMKGAGVHPNTITYSVLMVASEKKNEIELGFDLLSQAKKDGILPNLRMCQCLTGLCMQRYEKAYELGEPILSFDCGRPQIDSKWTKLALMVYRETISARLMPSLEVFSQVLGCLKFPNDISVRKRFVENLGISVGSSRQSNLYSLLDGFGEYDPRAFSICEEASSLGVVSCISYKDNPIVVDARKLRIHVAEVYLLTILESLKHRLAAGAMLPNVTILLPTDKKQVLLNGGEKNISLSGRVGQAVTALLRRLGLPYQGDESYGKIRIKGLALRRWFKPKIEFQLFGAKLTDLGPDLSPLQSRLAQEIASQRRGIRNNSNFFHP